MLLTNGNPCLEMKCFRHHHQGKPELDPISRHLRGLIALKVFCHYGLVAQRFPTKILYVILASFVVVLRPGLQNVMTAEDESLFFIVE